MFISYTLHKRIENHCGCGQFLQVGNSLNDSDMIDKRGRIYEKKNMHVWHKKCIILTIRVKNKKETICPYEQK